MDTLQKTAMLLVILSPGYLASAWCQRERETFLQLVRERIRAGSRVFIVECGKVAESKCPPEFQELLGYRFWVEDDTGGAPRTLDMPKPNADDPNDRPYYDKLEQLSHDLAEELKRLQEAAENGVPPPDDDPHPTVFLAEVTDDLDLLHSEVKRYLDQAGLRVLPITWYAREPTAYHQAMRQDLATCKLFVQLLSGVAGKKPPGLLHGYARLQYECAKYNAPQKRVQNQATLFIGASAMTFATDLEDQLNG
jgi:hypothetical protein